MKTCKSYSSRETKEFGAALAKKIIASQEALRARIRAASTRAVVVALQGDLGAGKTIFTQGFARGLGIKRRMASPTFIIMRRFAIPRSAKNSAAGSTKNSAATLKNIYHIDAYRLKELDSLEVLGFKEILTDPQNILLVEWPEKIRKILPKGTIWLKFRHGKKENERIIKLF